MEEKLVIKKIQGLREIKPNKDWVLLTKKEILKRDKKFVPVASFGRLFAPIRKPALVFALRGVIVATVILAGAFFYLYYLNSQALQLTLEKLPFFNNDNYQTEKMMASLAEVKANLSEIQLSLEKLKDIKSPSRALAATSVIKATADRNREALGAIKSQSSSRKVLASISEIDETLTKISEDSYNLQKEMISAALNDLKNRSLSEREKSLLEKAEFYYGKGDIEEAMIFIIKITEQQK